ncbi:MAG TPA: aspartyl protease family protein, partial [Myxococcota bacterium]|nr:aspartyl protease family protein [Myxococcota bacterium]
MSPALVLLSTALARQGPAHATVDLVRASHTSPRVFVEVELSDGQTGLMMVDTGADVSALAPSAASAAGRERRPGVVHGITDQVTVEFGRVPSIRVGAAELRDVEVAIGLPGQADSFGLLPVLGVLGNNVWSQWILDLDYHANKLSLHRPGSLAMPRGAAPLRFDGAHVHTPVRLTTSSGDEATIILAIDTGASEVLLLGNEGIRYDGPYTEGVEPVLGITTDDGAPGASYLQRTRRLTLDTIELGGHTVRATFDARWLDWERPDTARALAVHGLIGHEVLDGSRVIVDYQGGRIALTRSHKPARSVDPYELLLRHDTQRFGDAPERLLYRARLLVGLGRKEEALDLLMRLLATGDPSVLPLHNDARVLAARLRRLDGDLDGAWALLAPLSPAELVAAGEILAVVDGLLLEGRLEEAEDVSRAAIGARPNASDAWAARADVLLEEGLIDDAALALRRAGDGDDEARVLRRLRIAVARGDHDGAMATLRGAVLGNPLEGRMAWLYATLARPDDRATAALDLRDLTETVHARLLPLDYLAGAYHTLGDEPRALELMRAGIARDCDPMPAASDRDN